MTALKVQKLGDYIREQRNNSQISLRQLARLAGVSNPYLSQIERGLRKPSAEILQQIAKALRISAEALYVQAGILEEREGDTDVVASILRDELITERQKQVLLEIYDSFRKENDAARAEEPATEPDAAPKAAADAGDTPEPATPAKRPARKAAPRRKPQPDPETAAPDARGEPRAGAG